MHIKQITISNFRSFRQHPEIQPFSSGMNAVVGRNGSGKSNLFDAVQFCLLAPRFANLRAVRYWLCYRCLVVVVVDVIMFHDDVLRGDHADGEHLLLLLLLLCLQYPNVDILSLIITHFLLIIFLHCHE